MCIGFQLQQVDYFNAICANNPYQIRQVGNMGNSDHWLSAILVAESKFCDQAESVVWQPLEGMEHSALSNANDGYITLVYCRINNQENESHNARCLSFAYRELTRIKVIRISNSESFDYAYLLHVCVCRIDRSSVCNAGRDSPVG